jgi:hydroxypyruvate isomerase
VTARVTEISTGPRADRAGVSVRLDANVSWLFTEVPFDERFECAAAAGFAGVECSAPYEHPVHVVEARLLDAGVPLVLINAPDGAAQEDALERSRRNALRDRMLHALEYASHLRARVVHVPCGSVLPGVERNRAFAAFTDTVAWCAEQVADTPITIAVEAMNPMDLPRAVVASIDEALDIVTTVKHDRVRLLFDVYHCQMRRESIAAMLERVSPLTVHLQIADAPGRREPGTGVIDWPGLFERLGELGYDGWVGCEYKPTAGTREGLRWCEDLGLRGALRDCDN